MYRLESLGGDSASPEKIEKTKKKPKRIIHPLSEVPKRSRLVSIDAASSTESHQFLGDRDTKPFNYYVQPITAESSSPVWDDLLEKVSVDPDFRVAGLLFQDGRFVWTFNDINDFQFQHGILAKNVSLPGDALKARVSIRKRHDPERPENYS